MTPVVETLPTKLPTTSHVVGTLQTTWLLLAKQGEEQRKLKI